jgi:hypothetical protein
MTYNQQSSIYINWVAGCRNLVVIGALALIGTPAALAKDDFIMDTSSVGNVTHGVVSSDQFLELGVSSANALRLEGEQALRMGMLDRAITVLQRSVEMAPLDMDGRILYSEALEKKLMKEKDKDPVLYNFTIKQWLFVFKRSEFPDQAFQAYQHISMLTGTAPKRWEKPEKFLARVLLPEDGSTKVALGGKSKDDDKIQKGKAKEKDTDKDENKDMKE